MAVLHSFIFCLFNLCCHDHTFECREILLLPVILTCYFCLNMKGFYNHETRVSVTRRDCSHHQVRVTHSSRKGRVTFRETPTLFSILQIDFYFEQKARRLYYY